MSSFMELQYWRGDEFLIDLNRRTEMVNKMEEICYNFNIENKYISREVVEDEICEWTDDKQQRIPLRGKV